MADQAFKSTQEHIDKMKKEVEIEKLKMEEEQNNLEIRVAELTQKEEEFEKKKVEHETSVA